MAAVVEEENQLFMSNNEKKTSQGKRKIKIEEIQNKTRRQVTFSKRRAGLFKKASEICSLCGAEAAIVTFSGAGKLFSFGYPNASSVIRRYLNMNNSSSSSLVGTHIAPPEKNQVSSIPDPIIENLGLAELEDLKVSLEGLRNRAVTRLQEISSGQNNNVGDSDFGCMDWNNPPSDFGCMDSNNPPSDFGCMDWNNFPSDFGCMDSNNFPHQAGSDFAWMDSSLYDHGIGFGMPSYQLPLPQL